MKNKMIFNIYQANLFIQKGCRVDSVGVGRKGKVYISFIADDVFISALEQWNSKTFIH